MSYLKYTTERKIVSRLTETPEYFAWLKMKARCHDPNNYAYARYGGMGITVCERWLRSFDNFIADMGLRPSTHHSLDRYPDNHGPYSPDNCRWALPKEQSHNRRDNLNVTIGAETHCIGEWIRIKSLNPGVVYSRISRGCTPEEAITRPVRLRRRSIKS